MRNCETCEFQKLCDEAISNEYSKCDFCRYNGCFAEPCINCGNHKCYFEPKEGVEP